MSNLIPELKKTAFVPKVGMLCRVRTGHTLAVENITEINFDEKRFRGFYKKLMDRSLSAEEQRNFLKESAFGEIPKVETFFVSPGDVGIIVKIGSNTPPVSLNLKVHSTGTFAVLLINEKISKVSVRVLVDLYEEVK